MLPPDILNNEDAIICDCSTRMKPMVTEYGNVIVKGSQLNLSHGSIRYGGVKCEELCSISSESIETVFWHVKLDEFLRNTSPRIASDTSVTDAPFRPVNSALT